MRILVAELESAAVQVNLDGPASVRPEVLMYLRTALMPVVIAYLSMRQMWATGDSRVIRAKRMLVARLIVAMQVGLPYLRKHAVAHKHKSLTLGARR
jgi:hypothetical protein